MIDWEKAYFIGQTIAAAALVISLVFVGFQIRQANREARSQSRQAILDTFSSLTMELTHHPDMIEIVSRGVADWHALSNMEKTRFENLMGRYLLNIEKGRLLFEEGVLDKSTFDGIANFMVMCLMMPGAKTWIDGSIWPSPQLRSYLLQRLETVETLPKAWDEAVPYWAALGRKQRATGATS